MGSNVSDKIKEYRNSLKFNKNITVASNDAAVCCAQKAYLDVRRNFIGIGKWNEKEVYKNAVYKVIADSIYELFNKECSQTVFDEWHNGVCEKIENLAKGYKDVTIICTYGKAQKWLNMTLKDMYAWDLWNKELKKCEKHLHVPVDRYIMQAAWEKLGVKIPYKATKKNGDTFGAYSDTFSKPWSQWTCENYTAFQQAVREKLKGEAPILWEFVAWDEEKNTK